MMIRIFASAASNDARERVEVVIGSQLLVAQRVESFSDLSKQNMIVRVYKYVCTSACVCARVQVRVCACACVRACVCACKCACKCACVKIIRAVQH